MKVVFRPPLTYFLPGYIIVLGICLVLGLPLGLGLFVCAALSWEFYCSVAITAQGVQIRPASWRKPAIGVPAAQVVVNERFVVTGLPAPPRLTSPTLLYFSLDETDMDSTDQEISIWHDGQPLEHTLQRRSWAPLRAALLALGQQGHLVTTRPADS